MPLIQSVWHREGERSKQSKEIKKKESLEAPTDRETQRKNTPKGEKNGSGRNTISSERVKRGARRNY